MQLRSTALGVTTGIPFNAKVRSAGNCGTLRWLTVNHFCKRLSIHWSPSKLHSVRYTTGPWDGTCCTVTKRPTPFKCTRVHQMEIPARKTVGMRSEQLRAAGSYNYMWSFSVPLGLTLEIPYRPLAAYQRTGMPRTASLTALDLHTFSAAFRACTLCSALKLNTVVRGPRSSDESASCLHTLPRTR